MSYLRGSANYVWCTTSVLGKGATGAVFQGVSKHDGEPVAVKTFNQLSHMRPQEVQVREFEVLRKVNHENIVKLLAIEEEQDGRGKVIIMELCTGGSLFNILDDPENTYGLQEDEFLLVLQHLSAGMNHLRDNKLVHRDLKPGNIMKFVAEDGRIIYKLTDFGAARELEEDQEFMSLYGTEEYLHPDMYERAVLRKPVGKTFSASVDLWSIGVTLYHVATGNLPFRPYGGRKNKEMMHYITTQKESGVIAGSQTTENGPIDWKRELPASCRLSTGLKLLITGLLAGLLEVDPRKRLSFENFFPTVQSILVRKRIHIFYVNKIKSLRVYLDVEEHTTLSHLQCMIMEQTDIAPENQILLHGDRNFGALADDDIDNVPISCIPVTTPEDPIILFDRENNNVTLDWDNKEMPKFPTFPSLVNVENDATLAKQYCSVGYCIKRRIELICLSVNLINKAVKAINEVVVRDLKQLKKEGIQINSVKTSIAQQISLMQKFHEATQGFVSAIGGPVKGLESKVDSMQKVTESQMEEFQSKEAHLVTVQQPVSQLHSRFVENAMLMTEWEEGIAMISDTSRSSVKAATHVSKLRDSWQHLLRDRATRTLTYNDEQFHILERIKMQEKSKCLNELLNEDCQSAIMKLTEVLSDWYKTAQAAFIQSEILVKDTAAFQTTLANFLQRLNEAVSTYQTDLNDLIVGLKPFHHTHHSDGSESGNNSHDLSTGDGRSRRGGNNKRSCNRKEYIRNFNKGLKELNTVQEEVWTILKENAELVTQFQTLTLTLLNAEGSSNHASYDNNNKTVVVKEVEDNRKFSKCDQSE